MIKKIEFDTYQDKQIYLYELSNQYLKVGIIDFGAAIQYIKVQTPTKEQDVCLGFNTVHEYIESEMYAGATIGRVANRIQNASFVLNDKKYKISANDGVNSLHGGILGFDKQIYQVKMNKDSLSFHLFSPDKDMGYPGNLNLEVEFTLNQKSLEIQFYAESDQDTLWNPTAHTYFNLNSTGDIYDNILKINAKAFTPINEQLIPTGKIKSVGNTPFDFTNYKPIGKHIHQKDMQLDYAKGYDHNYILSDNLAASVFGAKTGIHLDIYTDLPGLQFYSGNYIKGTGRSGNLSPHMGFCLEPQYFPNAINISNFESPILKAKEPKKHYITYTFDYS